MTTHFENALQAAIAAGYKWHDTGTLYCKEMDGQFLCRIEDSYPQLIVAEKILLDPKFWQALGKAHDTALEKRHAARGEFISFEPWQWLEHWHRFLDHLANGGTIESYFASVVS